MIRRSNTSRERRFFFMPMAPETMATRAGLRIGGGSAGFGSARGSAAAPFPRRSLPPRLFLAFARHRPAFVARHALDEFDASVALGRPILVNGDHAHTLKAGVAQRCPTCVHVNRTFQSLEVPFG